VIHLIAQLKEASFLFMGGHKNMGKGQDIGGSFLDKKGGTLKQRRGEEERLEKKPWFLEKLSF